MIKEKPLLKGFKVEANLGKVSLAETKSRWVMKRRKRVELRIETA
jgi:hypothetical protein